MMDKESPEYLKESIRRMQIEEADASEILATALGYPAVDPTELFLPEDAEVPWTHAHSVGYHTMTTLAMESASVIEKLRNELAEATRNTTKAEPLTPKSYQLGTLETAFYPNAGTHRGLRKYVILGLTGEASEILEAVVNGFSLVEIIKEAGDLMWYVAQAYHCLNLGMPEESFDTIEPDGDGIDPLSSVIITCGRIAEVLKKATRDDIILGDQLDHERVNEVKMHLNALLQHLSAFATTQEFSLLDAAQNNLDKLSKRKLSGTLRGSGNDR